MSSTTIVKCDRCRNQISEGADVYVLFNNEQGRDVRIDLCGGCGIAFNDFMKALQPNQSTPAEQANTATVENNNTPVDQPNVVQ